MRIAIFQDTFSPSVNGVVVSTNLFREEMKRRGHQVLLIVPKRQDADYSQVDEDVVLVDAVDTGWIYPDTLLGKFWKKEVGARLKAFQPDVIHSMSEFTLGLWAASYWARKLGVPRVHTFHTLWTEYLFYAPFVPQFISQPLLRWVAPRTVKKRFQGVVAPTEKMREALMDDWGITAEWAHIDVVPTGINIDQFTQGDGARFKKRHGIRPEEKVVLYLGRMGDEKNVELVVDTFAELRRRGEQNVRFVCAGGGPERYMDKLRKRAHDHGVSDVLWPGFVRGQDWLDTYAAADVVLFPSTTETQGLVVIEALAAGKPLVSVEAMGPASTMKGEKGCLFAQNDAKDFADKTQRLLNDEVLYERKRREALEVARAYSIDQRAGELLDVYRGVLGWPAKVQVQTPEKTSELRYATR